MSEHKTPLVEDRKRSSPNSPTTPEDSRNPEKKLNLNKSTCDDEAVSTSIIVDPSKHSELELKLNTNDMMVIANIVKDALKDELKNFIKESITEATKSVVASISKVYEDRVKTLEAENRTLRTELDEVTERVGELEAQMDESEQYSRRNNIRISGFPVVPGENTDDIVLQMAKEMAVELDIEDIDRSHRVGKKSDGRTDILVKFSSYRYRRKFLQSRKKLRNSHPFRNVYINEDLTKRHANIMKEARQMVKTNCFKSAWTYDGRMLVKDRDDKTHVIVSLTQLRRI